MTPVGINKRSERINSVLRIMSIEKKKILNDYLKK